MFWKNTHILCFHMQRRHFLFVFLFTLLRNEHVRAEEPGHDGGKPAAARLPSDLTRPDIIDPHVLAADQGVDEKGAGPGQCRHNGSTFRHGQLLKTSLTCYQVLCSDGVLSWVPDQQCCLTDAGLQPQHTSQPTDDVCVHRQCTAGRWELRPNAGLCCQDGHNWYPVGSTRPARGGPCAYQLCHHGVWEAHYNTTCCFDRIGWHTPGTVLFTADPCRTKTCRAARWTVSDTCCRDAATGRQFATGDVRVQDACAYQLCEHGRWLSRTAFSCCERHGYQYEHGAVLNLGTACRRDRCVDGSWHVVRRERAARGTCGVGWRRLGHRCLREAYAGTWREATERCGSSGAVPVTVLDKEGWRALGKAGNNSMWIGLLQHDFSAGVLQWRWVDGTPLDSQVLWAPHEPKNTPDHACAFVKYGRAYSAPCDQKHRIICAATHCEH